MMTKIKVLVFLTLIFSVENIWCDEKEYAPIVQLKNGKVRGTVQESDPGSKVLLYSGIRYGK